MNFDLEVKLAVYGHFAETGQRPLTDQVAQRTKSTVSDVLKAYARLAEQKLLVLETDLESIHMAPPFSGVPTQHLVTVEGVSYFANCAWDSFGIPAALQKQGMVESRCEQSMEVLHLEVGLDGPDESDWLFHIDISASHWWDDIRQT